ncbi:hypothetical protein LEP1GSC038_0229 [Leptospira weilii str. 2006001855]|uniref:Uncharacterized protein n=1 Tax=Leptospira weilii str. 2006001855 TaxID=996804 RepID=M6FL15_9LEPT|nr:hypothetical protein LEP1GSC038_0229 [Leptospira weilii str. 2006001855]
MISQSEFVRYLCGTCSAHIVFQNELIRHLFGICVRLVWNLKDEKGVRTNAKRL